MTQNKKPVVLVAIILSALMIVPIIAIIAMKGGNDSGGGAGSGVVVGVGSPGVAAGYDLKQLASKADQLLAEDLAEALRKGDISLDFMADLNQKAQKARDALADGKLEKAEKYYTEVVESASAQLEALGLADKARALNDATYAELKRLEYLQAAFENTYREAVETYNQGLRDLNEGDFKASADGFEMASAILGELEGRSVKHVGGLLESAQIALDNFELSAARAAYEEVLRVDRANAIASEGLVMVSALEGIFEQVKKVTALEAAGKYEEALALTDELITANPSNAFLLEYRKQIVAAIAERDLRQHLAAADAAQAAGDIDGAIAELELAAALRASPELNERLAKLKAQQKAKRLEVLLATAYDEMKAGMYDAARTHYREAVALAPESKEARTGLEKASSLYLANIKYTQNIESANKYIKEGRYPLASTFFNKAMGSRPSNVPPSQLIEESRIRTELTVQSKEVSVTVESNKKTYVSLIGVFPPDRFDEKDVSLYPDIYKFKGTRKGYRDVEIELKLDARKSSQTIEVICTEKL